MIIRLIIIVIIITTIIIFIIMFKEGAQLSIAVFSGSLIKVTKVINLIYY